MADPQTPNRGYNVPITGSDVGTWGDSLNANVAKIDNNLGGVTAVALSSTNVTLTPTAAQYGTIIFTGAVTTTVTVTFPSVQGWWVIGNLTTGVGTFAIVSGGSNAIFLPPGEFVQICIDSSQNPQFVGLGRVGSYMDLAATSVPVWITGCSVPPYLLCNGSTFSGATYPILANFLGGTTLPDYRGRNRSYLNLGTGRITPAISGINGDVLFAAGGSEAAQQHTHGASGNTGSESNTHAHGGVLVGTTASSTPGGNFAALGTEVTGLSGPENQTHTHPFSFTTQPFGTGQSQNMPPVAIGGITLIRAA